MSSQGMWGQPRPPPALLTRCQDTVHDVLPGNVAVLAVARGPACAPEQLPPVAETSQAGPPGHKIRVCASHSLWEGDVRLAGPGSLSCVHDWAGCRWPALVLVLMALLPAAPAPCGGLQLSSCRSPLSYSLSPWAVPGWGPSEPAPSQELTCTARRASGGRQGESHAQRCSLCSLPLPPPEAGAPTRAGTWAPQAPRSCVQPCRPPASPELLGVRALTGHGPRAPESRVTVPTPATAPTFIRQSSASVSLWGSANRSSTQVSITAPSRTQGLQQQSGKDGWDAGLGGSGWAQSGVAG